jgi:hypothetical protein
MLLRKLQDWVAVDTVSSTVPTVGTNLVTVRLGNQKEMTIREIGGAMAPIWRNYYYGIQRIVYVVDASNLCQISAAGVLLYTILANPCLQKAKVQKNFLYILLHTEMLSPHIHIHTHTHTHTHTCVYVK